MRAVLVLLILLQILHLIALVMIVHWLIRVSHAIHLMTDDDQTLH